MTYTPDDVAEAEKEWEEACLQTREALDDLTIAKNRKSTALTRYHRAMDRYPEIFKAREARGF